MINAVKRPEASLPIKHPQNSTANVVPFGRDSISTYKHLNRGAIAHPIKRLPKPIQTIKQRSQTWLDEHLESALAKVDDALFELASNAHQQSEQDDYFFAMRELRNHHDAFIEAFNIELSQLFAGCADEAHIPEPTFESLAVIANEEFDELLVVETTVKRSASKNKNALMALAKRMAAVCECDEDITHLPIAPLSICNSLKVAAEPLQLVPNARLVLFKLFEQGVICELAELYQLTNLHLAECGILPDINNGLAGSTPKSLVRHKPKNEPHTHDDGLTAAVVTLDDADVPGKPKTAGRAVKAASHSTAPQSHENDIQALTEEIHSLQQLLNVNAAEPSIDDKATSQEVKSPAPARAEDFNQNVQQLLGLLADLQNKASSAALTKPNSLMQLLDGADVGSAGLASLFPQSPERKTLQVVDGLFGAMLTEQSLSNPLKELLARLQIPLARAAVVDPDILNNPNHSARQLINALARAGLAWRGDDVSALTKDPLYQKMQAIVERATTEYENDSQLFSDLVVDFEDFTLREQKRLALLERRMMDAEEGRAKAEAARIAVANTLGEACCNVQVDGVLNEFIHKAWQQVLYVTYLKHGEGSDEWAAAVNPLIDLMASLENLTDFIVCEYARQQGEKLLLVFKAGLDDISFDPFESERLLTRVADWFRELKPRAGLSHESAGVLIKDREKSTVDSAVALARDEKIADNSVSTSDEKRTLVNDAIDDIYYDQARTLQRGTWVDYSELGQPVMRCRLAAVIESTSTYIFVDRQGHKALEKSLLGLALAFKTQTLTAIDDGQLFDRALEQVIVSLRKKES